MDKMVSKLLNANAHDKQFHLTHVSSLSLSLSIQTGKYPFFFPLSSLFKLRFLFSVSPLPKASLDDYNLPNTHQIPKLRNLHLRHLHTQPPA